MAQFRPPSFIESDSNNGPSPGHSNLLSDEAVYICSSLLLTISWWLPYLAKDPRPDFNYGPGNDSNSGFILALQRLIESDLNNGPSPSHSNLVSNGVYICSGLPLTVSRWVPYLPKHCRPDLTRIVAPFPPGVYLSPTRIMPLPRPLQSCSSVLFMISWWLPHLAKGPTPDFNLGNDFNSDVSKLDSALAERNSQVTCTKHSFGLICLTSLGQPTIKLRRYEWETSTEGSLRRKKKKKNKVKEIQLANLARPSQAKIDKIFESSEHFYTYPYLAEKRA